MGLIGELRIRARHVLLPSLGVAAIVYFVYHGINGDRGLFAWRALQDEVATAQAALDQTRAEREILERRVSLLYPESLDRDMLDEYSRRLLNYGNPDEVVIFPDEAPAR